MNVNISINFHEMKFNDLLTRGHASLCKTTFCEISYIKDLGLFAGALLLGEKVPLTTNYYEVVLI